MEQAKRAHDTLIAEVYRAQANALAIEARAKMRLAEEYDAAQDRGEVQKLGGQLPRGVDVHNTPSAADLGIRRDEIHEARQFRDAERADPGIIDRTIFGMMNTLIVFQRMGAWLRRDGALWHLSGFAKQYARARGIASTRVMTGDKSCLFAFQSRHVVSSMSRNRHSVSRGGQSVLTGPT
jgi:hypothetical protein